MVSMDRKLMQQYRVLAYFDDFWRRTSSSSLRILEEMDIIHDEHCHVVEHKKTGDFGMKNTSRSSDAGSRFSGHNSGGSSHGGASNKASDRESTKSGYGRVSDSTGTGKQSAREPPPCLNMK
jgi:hypothetical protein